MLGERDLLRLAGAFDASAGALERALRAKLGDDVEVVHVDAALLTLAVPGASKRLPAILGALEDAGCDVRETTMAQPSLETLFIKLTGKELRE
jgi:ABC-2 type transport system ATP-binding protein